MGDYYDDSDADTEPLEAYCVSCKTKVEIEEPEAVWTRKGVPATRGFCSTCGGTVFRMGRTDAHQESRRPKAVEVGEAGRGKPALPQDAVYILFTEVDEDIARKIAADLEKSGMSIWLHEYFDDTAWASGVHPALQQCKHMVMVLSRSAYVDDSLKPIYGYFKERRKPIVVAQVEDTAPPDELRRSSRFDFAGDYKRAFREMMQALMK